MRPDEFSGRNARADKAQLFRLCFALPAPRRRIATELTDVSCYDRQSRFHETIGKLRPVEYDVEKGRRRGREWNEKRDNEKNEKVTKIQQ